MKIFIFSGNGTTFPGPDSEKTIEDFETFLSQKKTLVDVVFFNDWSDLLIASKKEPLAPIVVTHEEGHGARYRMQKRAGKRIFSINTISYAVMDSRYAIPVFAETFEEIERFLNSFTEYPVLTKGVVKNSSLGFESGIMIIPR